MIKVGIIGVTGYTGIELLRLLHQHPSVRVMQIITESHAGKEIADVFPHLQNHIELTGEALDLEQIIKNCDLVFLCLPHSHALKLVPKLIAAKVKVIDLGSDFRLKNPADFQQWYQHEAAPIELLNQAVYGLSETVNKELLNTAELIANPGCYPTAAILATMPALKGGIIDPDSCIFDAKSGISGSGRTFSLSSHFAEATENLSPYQIAGLHRHTPEIEQELSRIANKAITVQFTPHLIPMIRGLLVTAYFKLKLPLSTIEVQEIYHDSYKNSPFVRICAENKLPQVKNVRGTNYCDLGIQVDARTNRLIVVSAIDNLIKGAAGQAIQNMNFMYELPEITGLNNFIPIYP